MKEAGCAGIYLGVESGNDRVLGILQKGETVETMRRAAADIHAVGIPMTLSFILGNPTETREEMMDSLRLAKELRPSMIQVAYLTPYPGSELYRLLAERHSRLREYAQYDSISYNLSRVPDDELARMQRFFYRSFYLSPGAIWRYLTQRAPYTIFDAREWRLIWQTLRFLLKGKTESPATSRDSSFQPARDH